MANPPFPVVLQGTRWHSLAYGLNGGIIEYSFWTHHETGEPNAPIFTGTLYEPMKEEVRRALAAWAAVANIEFREVPDSAFTAQGGIRIGFTSDAPGGTLAGATRTSALDNTIKAAQLFVDDSEGWVIGAGGSVVSSAGNSFYHVVLHEIGHALGIAHYDGAPAIMNSVVNGLMTLQPSDIATLQWLYGPKAASVPNPEAEFDSLQLFYHNLSDGLVLSNGTYVVAYDSDSTFNGGAGGSRISLNGAGQTTNMEIYGRRPSLAALGNGGFLFEGSRGYQSFSAQGVPLSGALVGLNHAEIGNDIYTRSRATELASGGVVVVTGTAYRIYDGDGNYQDSNSQLHAVASGNGVTAGLVNGGFAWIWNEQANGQNLLKGEIRSDTGTLLVPEFTIGSGVLSTSVVALHGGGFFATWYSDASATLSDGSYGAIHGRIYAANGAPIGGEFIVNSMVTGNQLMPNMAVLPDGRVVVAWSSDFNVRARVFSAAGVPLGNDFQVDSLNHPGALSDVNIVPLLDGRVVFTFSARDRAVIEPGSHIYSRIIDLGPLGRVEHVGNSYSETVRGGPSGDSLAGAGGNDTLIGLGANDTLVGGTGNDLMDGGAGADSMTGGTGDDVYVLDSLADQVVEQLTGGGVDRVQSSSISLNLANYANVEVASLSGTLALSATGTAAANVLSGSGNSAANLLLGLGGNDTYIVGAGDTISELSTGGTDRVQSSLISLNLANYANVENITLAGSAALSATGNVGVNVIDGASNSAANTLTGLQGDDTYIVGTGDTVVETSTDGTADTVQSSLISLNLANYANVENITLTGSTLLSATGNSGSNRIDGASNSAGNTLTGLQGNDTYIVGSGDKIVEAAVGGGIDTVQSSLISLNLASYANVEIAKLTGTASLSVSGNQNNNLIAGNAGNNYLAGGAGLDTLSGGGGLNFYLFNTALSAATNVDTITDFFAANDTIRLENAIFTAFAGVATNAGIDAGNLVAGSGVTTAADPNDFLIYNTSTGDLFYDADGSLGVSSAVKFARLSNVASLTSADFVVI